MTVPFLDIHTHRTDGSDLAVYNLKWEETIDFIGNLVIISPNYTYKTTQYISNSVIISPKQIYSIGLHPWDVDSVGVREQLALLDRAASQDQVRLIGECGMDKLRGPELTIQKQVFAAHIDLANRHQKPLIIHCVRAFEELIAMTKAQPPRVPAIIHGFNKSPELARRLSGHGFLLSFGAALLNERSPARKVLQVCWKQGLPFFLETDNSPLSIEEIYRYAANLLKISEDALKDAIFASWKKIGLNHE